MARIFDLAAYDVDKKNGFLPSKPPLYELPVHYAEWDALALHLADCIKNGTIRSRIESMPCLTTIGLKSEAQWQRAYSLLSIFLAAYLWSDTTPAPIIPKPLAHPFMIVCQHLGLPLVTTYAGLMLLNWKLVDPAGAVDNLDNLDCLTSFTGIEDERWFAMISVAIEARAGKIIAKVVKAMEAVENDDLETAVRNMDNVAELLASMTSILRRMHTLVDPGIWYKEVRPFLAGSIDDRLPKGISFDDGKSYVRLAGSSNAQSSVFQFLDLVFDIRHEDTTFADDMRKYMPQGHRQFLKAVAESVRSREWKCASPELGKSYNACVLQLRKFRDEHIRVVSRYIVVQSRKTSSCRSEVCNDAPKGTGGTTLMPFLGKMRDETV